MTKVKNTSKSFVSLPIGSTVAVQWEDRGLWTHGTIEVKSNHNHHNRSYKIHITKTGKIVICNRQHIKPTLILAEYYFHDQLHKHIKTDPLENILAQLDKQPSTYNIINSIDNGQNSSNTTHGPTTVYGEQDNYQERGKENSEQQSHCKQVIRTQAQWQ